VRPATVLVLAHGINTGETITMSMANIQEKRKQRRTGFLCMRIGTSIVIPIDRSLVESLRIKPEETIFEEELCPDGILLKIMSQKNESNYGVGKL
jgi:hypothetical protein